MKLAVFGANGPTGRLLTQLALDEDHDVVAFTRHPEDFPIEHPRLEVTGGDVHDAAAVAGAIERDRGRHLDARCPLRQDPGDGLLRRRRQRHRRHARRRREAVGLRQLQRAVAPPASRSAGSSSRRIIQPYVVNTLGRTVYDDMRRMEAMVARQRPGVDDRASVGPVRGAGRVRLRRRRRPRRPPVHGPHRPRRLPAAPGARRDRRPLGDRRGHAGGRAVDAQADLAGRHPGSSGDASHRSPTEPTIRRRLLGRPPAADARPGVAHAARPRRRRGRGAGGVRPSGPHGPRRRSTIPRDGWSS